MTNITELLINYIVILDFGDVMLVNFETLQPFFETVAYTMYNLDLFNLFASVLRLV